MSTLTLTPIIDVQVSLSAMPVQVTGFDAALIIGPSDVIPTDVRVAEYTTFDEVSDAFTEDMPEYQAANLYFMQQPQPRRLLIGRRDFSEPAQDAVKACANIRGDWYGVQVCDATNEDILAVAGYVETQRKVQGFTTDYAAALEPTDGFDIFSQLKELNYTRTIGMYSSTTPYAFASVFGYVAGEAAGVDNSSYTLMFKTLPGVKPEGFTDEATVKTIKAKNGNVYVNRANAYYMFEDGIMANGYPFDEVYYLDWMATEMQYSIMNAFKRNKKIGQTDGQAGKLVTALTSAIDQFTQGENAFIAPGIWTGDRIMRLNTGDALPKGYLIQIVSMAEQNQADRENRKAPPIYVCLKLSGAIESAVIGVYVNR